MNCLKIRSWNWKKEAALLIFQSFLLLLVYQLYSDVSHQTQDPILSPDVSRQTLDPGLSPYVSHQTQDPGLPPDVSRQTQDPGPSFTKSLDQNLKQDILQEISERSRVISERCKKDLEQSMSGFDKKIAKFFNKMKIGPASKTRLVMPEKNLVWCMVPKAASTAIASAFVEAINKTSMLKDPNQPQAFLRKFYFYKNSFEAVSSSDIATYKSFYVTRHPFSRLVAAYREKLENSNVHDGRYFYETYGSPIVRAFRKGKPSLGKEPTFKEFVQYLLREDRQNFDQHWKPITSLCNVCHYSYDAAIRFENFPTEFDAFVSFLKSQKNVEDNFQIKAKNDEISTKAQRDLITKRYMKQLPRSFIQKLHVVYRLDFKYFNYNLTEFV